MTVDFREQLRWMLTLSPEKEGIARQDVDNRQANDLVVAAFSTAVERSLGDAPSVEEIQRVVQSIRGTYVKAEELQSVQAEAVVRALYGEHELVGGMPYVEMTKIQLSLTYGIVQLLNLKDAAFEEFIDEAMMVFQEFDTPKT